MEFDDLFPAELKGSSIENGLRALHELYAKVEEATGRFQASAGGRFARDGARFGCPAGCGACCERFMPDVLPAEADYAALWIMRHRPELAAVEPRDNPPCPYYDPDRPEAHCRIYGGRPLICRLFGWAAVMDKDGAPTYSLCWKMDGPAGGEARSWTGASLEETFGMSPPLMAPFGLALESLAGDAPRPRPLVGQAVRASVARLAFLRSLALKEDAPHD